MINSRSAFCSVLKYMVVIGLGFRVEFHCSYIEYTVLELLQVLTKWTSFTCYSLPHILYFILWGLKCIFVILILQQIPFMGRLLRREDFPFIGICFITCSTWEVDSGIWIYNIFKVPIIKKHKGLWAEYR